MSESVYKIIDLVGSSPTSWEEAAKNAVDMASKSLRDLRVAEIEKLDLALLGTQTVSILTLHFAKRFEQKPLNNLTSYCGIIPRVKQSGGIEGHTHTGRVSKRSNHLLKDSVVQSAFQMGLRGPQPLLQDYKRREAAGQHADFGIGRRFLRMAMCLMRTSQVYLPPTLRSPKTQPG